MNEVLKAGARVIGTKGFCGERMPWWRNKRRRRRVGVVGSDIRKD